MMNTNKQRFKKMISPFHSVKMWVRQETHDEVQDYLRKCKKLPLLNDWYKTLKARVEVDEIEFFELVEKHNYKISYYEELIDFPL